MHVALYRALKSVKIGDEAASQVVAAMEEHMAKSIAEAVSPLELKIDALTKQIDTTIDALTKQIDALNSRLTWFGKVMGTVMGLIGFGVAVAVALGPAIAKIAS